MGKGNVFGISLTGGTSSFVAGSHLKGVLWTNVEKERPAKDILLSFSGTEQSIVKYPDDLKNRRDNSVSTATYYKHACRSSNLIHVNLPIDSSNLIQNGALPVGKYEIPFDIPLPRTLPNSMRESYHDGSYCEIVYKLTAEITGSSGGGGGILANIINTDSKCQQDVVIVAQPLPRDPVPYMVPPETETVSALCCVSRGSITVTAAVTDTKLDRGETIQMALAARNQSSSSVSKVECKLLQNCEWKAEHQRRVTNTVLQTVVFQGLPDTVLANSQSSESSNEALLREVRAAKHVCAMTLPTTAHCTYRGKTCSIEHSIEIVVHTGSCVSNPTLIIPVQTGPTVVSSLSTATATTPVPWTGGATTIATNEPETVMGGTPTNGETPTIVATVSTTASPSVARLQQEMQASLQYLSIIQTHVGDSSWKSVFSSLSIRDFGAIVGAVSSEFEQVAVAEAMARVIDTFTCAHTAAAVRECVEWNRSQMVERLLPFCKDNDHDVVQECLSEWESLSTKPAFEAASKR